MEKRALTLEEVAKDVVGRIMLAITPANHAYVPARVLAAEVHGDQLRLEVRSFAFGWGVRESISCNAPVVDDYRGPPSFRGVEVRPKSCVPGILVPVNMRQEGDGTIVTEGGMPGWYPPDHASRQFFLPRA